MGVAPGLYSRVVAVLKVVLPLTAIGLLASLFLFQAEDDFGGDIIFTDADLESLGQGLQISNPTFTGVTSARDHFRFTAELVVPDAAPPERASITSLKGAITFANGAELRLESQTGEIDIPQQQLAVAGDVRIDTSAGYRFRSDSLAVDLSRGTLASEVPVSAVGPLGQIEAGWLRVGPKDAPAEGDAGARIFSFGNGVRLIYDPRASMDHSDGIE